MCLYTLESTYHNDQNWIIPFKTKINNTTITLKKKKNRDQLYSQIANLTFYVKSFEIISMIHIIVKRLANI